MTDHHEFLDLIRHESVGIVAETLDFWLNECAISEAPSAAEVSEWQSLLAARGGKFDRLAKLCETWLEEEAQAEAPRHDL